MLKKHGVQVYTYVFILGILEHVVSRYSQDSSKSMNKHMDHFLVPFLFMLCFSSIKMWHKEREWKK